MYINKIVFKVKIADNPLQWQIGLSDIINLEDKECMLFIFPESKLRLFHMKEKFSSTHVVHYVV